MILQHIKKKGRASVLVVSLIVSLACIGGCQKKEDEKPIEITFMHGWGGSLKTHYTMQQIYEEFSRENPDIILKSKPYPDSSIAVEKANDMLAVGRMPDIISTNGLSYYVTNAVKRKMAMDLIPYLKKDAAFGSQIHPSIYETWTNEAGQLYTIPDVLEVAGYWYNSAYLEQAGVVDTYGRAKVPATWDEFFAMTDQLQAWAGAQEIAVCSLDLLQLSENLFQARLAGEGENGRAASENSGTVLNVETVNQTMTDLRRLCESSVRVDSIENARQNFMDGKSVLYFNGVWESDALSDSARQSAFQYAAYPTNSGERLSYVSPSSGYVLAVQSDERKQEACLRFLKYMLSEKVQMELAAKTGQAPSNPEVNFKKVKKETPMFADAVSIAYDADIQIKTIVSVWSEEKVSIVRTYCESVQQVWSEDMSAKMTEYLNSAADN